MLDALLPAKAFQAAVQSNLFGLPVRKQWYSYSLQTFSCSFAFLTRNEPVDFFQPIPTVKLKFVSSHNIFLIAALPAVKCEAKKKQTKDLMINQDSRMDICTQ